MPFPRAYFRKIAAATSVICDELGGEVGRLDLMKILFSSDRTMLEKCERTITGDWYYSLPKGPILSYTLHLASGKCSGALQKEWDSAFEKVDHAVVSRPGIEVDTDCLSDEEEQIIRRQTQELMDEKKRFMNRFGDGPGAAKWIEELHDRWKEWSNPGDGRLPLPLEDVLRKGLKRSPLETKRIVSEDKYAKAILAESALAEKSIIVRR